MNLRNGLVLLRPRVDNFLCFLADPSIMISIYVFCGMFFLQFSFSVCRFQFNFLVVNLCFSHMFQLFVFHCVYFSLQFLFVNFSLIIWLPISFSVLCFIYLLFHCVCFSLQEFNFLVVNFSFIFMFHFSFFIVSTLVFNFCLSISV